MESKVEVVAVMGKYCTLTLMLALLLTELGARSTEYVLVAKRDERSLGRSSGRFIPV